MSWSEHPLYLRASRDWLRWRLTYAADDQFVNTYLYKLSNLEADTDLEDRKQIAYAPAFATAAIDDVKNSLFQRISEVARVGGPKSYQEAVQGLNGGVDYRDSSISTFLGLNLLSELLVLSRVGVLVDNFNDIGTTLADKANKHPYLDVFCAEDILNWYPTYPVNGFEKLLLRSCVDEYDELGLPVSTVYNYRYYEKVPDGILVTFYNNDKVIINETFLQLEQIPFVLFELPHSLMHKVDKYQIALLNLESSDISFARKANFPFYYEFTDDRHGTFNKGPAQAGELGTKAEATASKPRKVTAGLTHGRQFPKGLDPPGFIQPDADTLRVSMEKGQQLKEDIRRLINLNIQNLDPRRQAADSKEKDSEGLESGLSFIGLVLERGEREIAKHWTAFEGEDVVPKITYPKTYKIKTDAQRREEVKELEDLLPKIPSETFRKETLKKMAITLLGIEVPETTKERILQEIETSKTLTTDPNIVLSAHKEGLVDDELAAVTLGFPKETVEKAREDRAARLALVLEAQGGSQNADGNRGAHEFGKGLDEKANKQKRGQQDNTNVGSEQK